MRIDAGRLYLIIVTYRRAESFPLVLDSLGSQRRVPDELVVVDNSPAAEIERAVGGFRARIGAATYLPSSENLGPAGGTATGMRYILERADDADWIMRLDDDYPLERDDVVERMETFAHDMYRRDDRTGAVGMVGSRFDWRRGRLIRATDDELGGPVSVDYVATNTYPLFRVGAVRAVGPLRDELFYGSSEVEYGLRLRQAGFHLYANGPLWREFGRRSADSAGPGFRLRPYNWRRYYSLRNLVWTLNTTGHRGAAARVAFVRGIAKPLANLPVEPRSAVHHLRMNTRAIADAYRGRLGRTIDPVGPGGSPDGY